MCNMSRNVLNETGFKGYRYFILRAVFVQGDRYVKTDTLLSEVCIK